MDTVLDMVVDTDMDMDMVMDTTVSVRLRQSLRPRLILTFCMVDMLTMVKQETTNNLFYSRKFTEQPSLFSSSVT